MVDHRESLARENLADALHALAEADDFSGITWVSDGSRPIVRIARGMADRAEERPITASTRFATASLTKGFTALAVASLIEDGTLRLETTARSLLGDALPLVDPAVTIEHLLAHTSGIGDYLDEDELDDIDDYVLAEPVHTIDRPEAFLPILGGHPQQTYPGATFAYNNGAYVVLSILVERASGRDYYELVQERVLDRAGMSDTAFDRSDRPRPGTALGYLADGRTNLLHLPVRGAGDGGLATTARDLEALWTALFDGRILPIPAVERMIEPRNRGEGRRYGLGFWLHADRDIVMLEGFDAGISSRTAYDRSSGRTYTVLANTSAGAWPIARYLDDHGW